MYRPLLLGLISILLSVSATAQQPLDARSLPTPSKRFSRTIADPTGVVPGPGGVGRTWDFRNLRPGPEQIQTYLAFGELPQSVRDSFPTAQVGINIDTTLSLYATVGKYFRLIGVVTPNTQLTVTTDPYDTRPTEIVYSGRLIDAHKAIIRVGGGSGPTINRFGQTAVEYDGFGTLILPKATYSNVARITTTGSTTDTLVIGAATTVVRRATRRTTYQVFNSDTSLLEIEESTTTTTRNGQQVGQPVTRRSVIHFGWESTTSVEEDRSRSIVVSPNPSNGSVVNLNGFDGEVASIGVFDITGSRIDGASWSRNSSGVRISLPNLGTGSYVITLERGDGSVRVMPITVLR